MYEKGYNFVKGKKWKYIVIFSNNMKHLQKTLNYYDYEPDTMDKIIQDALSKISNKMRITSDWVIKVYHTKITKENLIYSSLW